MTQQRRRLGRRGEARARRYLKRQGLAIVARNWRCRFGELDLVARDGDVAVFIEVRTSSGRGFAGGPAWTVGPDKQRRVTRLARAWLQQSRWSPAASRFDVVAVRRLGWFRWEICWYRSAFTCDEA